MDNQANAKAPLRHQEADFNAEFNLLPVLPVCPIDDKYVTAFLARENNSGLFDPPVLPLNHKLWIKRARLWMLELALKCVAHFGLWYRTAYLGMVFFERFVSLRESVMKWKAWAIKYLGLVCLSLAGKMEAGLVEVPVAKLIKEVKRMELLVLDALEWKMLSLSRITPFSYMEFFVRKFDGLPDVYGARGRVVVRTAAFIFAVMKVNGALEYRPSVVAAAATLAAMDPTLTKAALEQRISASPVSNYGFTATAEQVHRCYVLINKLDPYKELVFPDRG